MEKQIESILTSMKKIPMFSETCTMESIDKAFMLTVMTENGTYYAPSIDYFKLSEGENTKELLGDIEAWLYGLYEKDEEAIKYLKEDNLSDDDIDTVFKLVTVGVEKGWIQKDND